MYRCRPFAYGQARGRDERHAELRHLSTAARTQVETRFDAEYGVYWAFLNPRPRACITNEVLADLRAVIDTLSCDGGWIADEGERKLVRHGVIASRTPGVFNLGGDPALFRAAIRAQDRDALYQYSERCVDVLHPWYRNCDLEMTTMALVQGDALGGGFEGANSN